jgi:hypothetical protein
VEILLALVLAAPVVAVQSDGAAPCDTAAFAKELRTLRPELAVLSLETNAAVPIDSWRASLEGMATDQAALRVTGRRLTVLRPLPGQDCEWVVRTAASIIDGLLDELPLMTAQLEPARRSSRTNIELSGWIGAGVAQGPLQWGPTFDVGGRLLFWRSAEVIAGADIGLPATTPLATVDEGLLGNYRVLPFDLELGAGYGPRLGPGRLSLDLLIGLSFAEVWTNVPGTEPLFGRTNDLATEFFLAPRVSYAIDLPLQTFIGLSAEERGSPARAAVTVVGGTSSVMTRTWTLASTIFFGRRFF